MIIIIAGSRSFRDYDLLEAEVLRFLKEYRSPAEAVTIISGTARGADQLGERFAEKFGLPLLRMPADWNRYGRGAGHVRNAQMAQRATHCIVFWDGQSRGSKNMIETAEKAGLTTRAVRSVGRSLP